MAEATANLDQQATRRDSNHPQRVKAARAYQKTNLTEGNEEELLQSYAPIISQMVHRFAPLVRVTVDVDDLKNIASLALIQAAHGYDPGQGMSFKNYANMRIRGSILDEIRKSQPLSRTIYSRRKELEATIEALRMELNRQPTEEEISERMGIAVDQYRQLLDKLRPVIFVPLHQLLEGEEGFGSNSNEHHAADLNQENPAEQAARHELHEMIRDRIQQLNRQQQKVLLLFYYEGLRMKDIAELLNVSESRVCQINTEAVLSLRSFLQRRERV
jgi:RNA polymerase sigma factor for flagellar operon FliA